MGELWAVAQFFGCSATPKIANAFDTRTCSRTSTAASGGTVCLTTDAHWNQRFGRNSLKEFSRHRVKLYVHLDLASRMCPGSASSACALDITPTCMRCGRTSLTSSPFIRFEWQDNVRTYLSAQQIRSCTPSDGACGCYCCRAGCASCCSGAIRLCTGLHGSLPAAGIWDTSSSCTSIPTRAKIGPPSVEPTTVLLRRGRHLRPRVSDQISPDDEGVRFLLLSRR